MMKKLFSLTVLPPLLAGAVEYEKPVRLLVDGEPIALPSPGYASPCLHDLDGDGMKDLLVGQYRHGKIMVYPGIGPALFGPGQPLQAEGETVKIPGIW